MRSIIVVTFPAERAAYEGLRALERLHGDGTITVYDTTVVERQTTGEIAVKPYRHASPRRRTDIESSTRAFDGMFGAHLHADAFALIADVHEKEPAPIDSRIADLGGTIVHRVRPGSDDAREILQRAAEDARHALDQTKLELHDKLKALQQQLVNVRGDSRTDIEQRIVEVRRELGQRERKLSRVLQTVTRAITPRPPVPRARWRSGAGPRAARAR